MSSCWFSLATVNMQQDDGKASATEQVRRPARQPIRIISFGIKEMDETEEDEVVISVVFIGKSFYALITEYSIALPTKQLFVCNDFRN